MNSNIVSKLIDFALTKKRFLKFFSVGALSAVIDLSLFFILNQFFSLDWLYAFSVTFILVGAFNYWLNKTLTFKNKSNKVKEQFTVFLIIALIGFFLNLAVMFLLIEFTGISIQLFSFELWPTIARFIAMWCIVIVNYTLHKKITFKKFE
ncbi:MAG: GtrA family protein [Candidatus Diapherotrites archaeon]|nr:GtrA family protein [Candidatus Diapherotrites archaeon]